MIEGVAICPKCSLPRTRRTDGKRICVPCLAAAMSAMHDAKFMAGLRWKGGVEPRTAESAATRKQEPSPIVVFEAVWTARSVASGPRRLNPNAGRLKAGESLYQYAPPAETTFDWADE